MISTAGMTPMLALTLIERERPVFEKGVKDDPTSKREIAAFKERIGQIDSVDALMKDFEVFSFVMKSFGMENQLYAKGMMKKIMTSDIDDKKSLVNRLTNSDYKELHKVMGFDTEGKASKSFTDPKWVDGMVERYVDQRLVDSQSAISPSVGDALGFLDKVENYTSWYKVLADKDASRVMRVALGIPESVSTGDIDAQKRLFEKKMDIKDLQDPKKVQQLVRKFAAIEGANQAMMAPVGIMTLFQPAADPGSWAPIMLNIDAVTSMRGYRP